MSTLESRFWSKVDKESGPHISYMDSPCWQWSGYRLQRGYGTIRCSDKKKLATHVALILDGVDIPSEMIVCHHCDNPSCVRASHLFLGSHKDNAQDAIQKGRATKRGQRYAHKGENNGRAKLSWQQVRAIRKIKSLDSRVSNVWLSRQFGVSHVLIGLVVRDYIWKE